MKEFALKKFLTVATVALMILAVSACSKKGADTAAGTVDSGKKDGGKTVITMLFSGTPAAENDLETVLVPKLIEAHFPNVKVEVTKLPDDNYYTALRTKLASGEAPDMFLVQPKYAGSNGVITLAKAGYLAPVTELKCLDIAGRSGAASFAYNGQIYGVPQGVTMLGTFYNKDMFAKYNIALPTNWDEFLAACETLKKNNIQPIVMGDKDMYVLQFGLYQIAPNVVYAKNPSFDDDLYTGKTHFTDPGTWDTVLTMYKTLYDKGYISTTSLGTSAQQAIQKFIDGEAAMTFDGNFNTPAIRGQGKVTFERGYFPLPANAKGQETYAAMSISGSPAIYSGSKNIDLCKQILEYWCDGQSDLYKATADSGKVIVTYGYGSDKVDPLYQPFMDIYHAGRSFYWCNQAWPAGTETEMEAKFSEMVGGQGAAVADITKAMQAKFEDLSADM